MTEPTPGDMLALIDGFRVTRALATFVELGMPGLLRDGGRTSAELADAAGAHEPSLYRLLRALAAVGVVHEGAGRVFELAALGRFLRADHPATVAPVLTLAARPYFQEAWGNLAHSVRTGETAFAALHGTDVWEWRSWQPEENAIFNRAMTAVSRVTNAAMVRAYDFGRFARVVDVGGGNGAMLAAILAAHPGMRGTLFDQPHVVSGAAPVLAAAGVADRCEVVGGDMFASMPAGADAYTMKMILHDWDDERSAAILRVCRQAMAPDGRVLLVEMIVGPANEGRREKLSDLNMMVLPGGRERTREEWEALLEASGFRLVGVTATATPSCVIEAAPV